MRAVLVLAAIGVVALCALMLVKPKTSLPAYQLLLHDKSDQLHLEARIAEHDAVDGATLQAEAFFVDDDGVHTIQQAPSIDADGTVHLDGALVASAKGRVTVGLIVGRKDSMPGAIEAWEELQTEGLPRPAFRVLTATLDRSAGRDRSDPPSP